jgi:NTE family protein
MLTAMVFSGGLGLASYHAGAYQSFHEHGLPLDWVTGSSAGAVTAALVAGNAVEERIGRLEAFWQLRADEAVIDHPFRHLQAWTSVVRGHLVGHLDFFHVRRPSPSPLRFRSIYDLAPMRERLRRLVDFGRLNSGETRVSICATNVESGDAELFDTNDGPLEMDHLLASCGLLPEFAPVEVNGALYVDGGLSANAPFDPILRTNATIRMFVVDLFSRDGSRPKTLEAAGERKTDLMFGNQTFVRLRDHVELRRLRKELGQLTTEGEDDIFLLSYQSGPEEPGPEKPYNFSRNGLATRWSAGRRDMAFALNTPGPTTAGIRIVRRPTEKTLLSRAVDALERYTV